MWSNKVLINLVSHSIYFLKWVHIKGKVQYENTDKSTESIVARFTNAQQTIIWDKYKKVKSVIQAKGNTVAAERKAGTKKIADCVKE